MIRNRIFLQIIWVVRNYLDKHSYRIGKNNSIVIKGIRVGNRFHISGNNNSIFCGNDSLIKNNLFHIQGNNNVIEIEEECCISGAEIWIEDNNCLVKVGKNTFIGHHTHIACTEDNSHVSIGSDCMLSSYVQIRTGDSHSILTLDGVRINKAKSIEIGNHCWLGEGVTILKGVSLSNDVIVSTGAIVTKSYNNNTLLGGVPAKILKEEITWDSRRL